MKGRSMTGKKSGEPVILSLPVRRGRRGHETTTSAVETVAFPNNRPKQESTGGSVALTVALAALVLGVALCGPALYGLVFTADDLGAFHLPLRAFYAAAIASGDSFDWCPALFGGFYLTGEGQAGTYHPLHLLLYRLLPLSWAWNIECLASYPFLFGGVWLLLRRRGFEHAESLFGALVFTFCGFNLLHFVHVNSIGVVAHIPWLLYAIDRMAARRIDCQSVLQDVCITAALTGSQLLLGYPQYVAYSLLAEALYLVLVLYEKKSAGGRPPVLWLSALWVIAKLFGLAIAAVQILPTIEALSDSVRQGVDSSFSESGSLHPLNFVQLLAPYLFTTRVVGQNTHELSLYVGIVPLLLSIVAVMARLAGPNAAVLRRFALVLVALGSLIAVGKHGPLQNLLVQLPYVGYFRFPCRAILLFELGIGLLAALGFSAIHRALCRGQPTEIPLKTFCFVAVATLAVALIGPARWPEYTIAGWRVWYGPALLVLAAGLLHSAARGSRLALHAAVALAAIDLGGYGLSYAVYRDTHRLADYVADSPTPPGPRGTRVALDLARPDEESPRAGNQILLRGFARIDGYAGLVPAQRLDYRQPATLRAAGVEAVHVTAPLAGDTARLRVSDEWLRIDNPLPRARVVHAFRPADEPASELFHIELAGEVLVERADQEIVESWLVNSASARRPTEFARIVDDRPGNLVIELSASEPAIVVLNESYHRGWNVTAAAAEPSQSGQLQEPRVLRVNGDFLGCLVPAGRLTVEFRFAPTSLRYGRLISVCGLGLLVVLSAAATWRRAGSVRRPAPLP
jgi:hypothetical protein